MADHVDPGGEEIEPLRLVEQSIRRVGVDGVVELLQRLQSLEIDDGVNVDPHPHALVRTLCPRRA